ncbi:translation protein SH3-like domain-containing protein [Fomitopsis serialis]|uniref:translation protein SH3-like domain-containing protein n=1 Tax=Fomitopsis serialis TaxID=139415 RepID=UPI002007B0D2|nr:translation protein SH3-like domain-containing protein [Neoantrodia serialis]KAH9938433.1 translation protein SH3-like domain-containing protein [Neoantrodia serialis]
MLSSPFRQCARALSTAAQPYPFSKLAKIIPVSPNTSTVPREPLLKGKGLMQHLKETLPTPEKLNWLQSYFARRHPSRIMPGSVLTVSLGHAPTTFSGVLLSVRRRGLDTSFVLRNVINRTGVEMQFYVCSPHLKNIKILQRAATKTSKSGPRIRRVKLYYLRDSPEKMTAISAGVRG